MNKQKGFSAVIVLLSLLLLVVVGFTGYYVLNNQQNKKDTTAEVAPATATKQETKVETPAPAKEEQKYLVIKEWGVKIPLNGSISGATYELKESDLASITIIDPKVSNCKYSYGIIKSTVPLQPNTDKWGSGRGYTSLSEIDGIYYVGIEEDGATICIGGDGDLEVEKIYGSEAINNAKQMINTIIAASKAIQKN